MVDHFLDVYRNRMHTTRPELLPETKRVLQAYPWPGNIRELENVIHRALLVCDGKALRPLDLNLPTIQLVATDVIPNNSVPSNLLQSAISELIEQEPENLYEHFIRKVVEQTYEHCRQNQVQTARVLGVSRNVLRTLLKQFGIIQ